MSRESRHLQVTAPDYFDDQRLATLYSQYGRVQKIERQDATHAVVSFTDVRSAQKAHADDAKLSMRTQFYELHKNGGKPSVSLINARRNVRSNESSELLRGEMRMNGSGPLRRSGHRTRGEKHCRGAGSASPSSCSASPSPSTSTSSPRREYSNASEPISLIVTNLAARSSDSSIKDAIYDVFKKFGKVQHIDLIGEADSRHAIVNYNSYLTDTSTTCASSALDIETVISETSNLSMLGSRIRVRRNDDVDSRIRPGSRAEGTADPFDNKYNQPCRFLIFRSSRTLYIGGLERRVAEESLKSRLCCYGTVLDVDVKNRDSPSPFAFVQFSDIASVVRAIHDTRAKQAHNKDRVKVGFGRTPASTMLWMDKLPPNIEEEYLSRKMRVYGELKDIVLDQALHQALIIYAVISSASDAVKQLKSRARTIAQTHVHVDYGSDKLHDLFVDRMFGSGKPELLAPPPLPPPDLAFIGSRAASRTSSERRADNERCTSATKRRERRRQHSSSSSMASSVDRSKTDDKKNSLSASPSADLDNESEEIEQPRPPSSHFVDANTAENRGSRDSGFYDTAAEETNATEAKPGAIELAKIELTKTAIEAVLATKKRPSMEISKKQKEIPLDATEVISDPRSGRIVHVSSRLTIPVWAVSEMAEKRRQAGLQQTTSTPVATAVPAHVSLSRSASSGSDAMMSPDATMPLSSTMTDIFGDSNSPPTAVAHLSSFHDRIRALDAKFSKVDENLQKTKKNASMDYDRSKYVVKKRSDSITAAVGVDAGGGDTSKSEDPLSTPKTLRSSSIFEQDLERLRSASSTVQDLDPRWPNSTLPITASPSCLRRQPVAITSDSSATTPIQQCTMPTMTHPLTNLRREANRSPMSIERKLTQPSARLPPLTLPSRNTSDSLTPSSAHTPFSSSSLTPKSCISRADSTCKTPLTPVSSEKARVLQNKESQNKALDQLFRQQAKDSDVNRKKLNKTERKADPGKQHPAKPPTNFFKSNKATNGDIKKDRHRDEHKEKNIPEKKTKPKDTSKFSEAELRALEDAKKEKEKRKKLVLENKKLDERKKISGQKKHKRPKNSSDSSSGSDSEDGFSEDENQKEMRKFAVGHEDEIIGAVGLSMYDRVKRRSSAATKADDVAKKNRTLQILREHTLKKKKRPGRVRVDTDGAQSDSSDGSDLSETDDETPRVKKMKPTTESENEEKSEKSEKKTPTVPRKKHSKPKPLSLDDVFGADSSEEDVPKTHTEPIIADQTDMTSKLVEKKSKEQHVEQKKEAKNESKKSKPEKRMKKVTVEQKEKHDQKVENSQKRKKTTPPQDDSSTVKKPKKTHDASSKTLKKVVKTEEGEEEQKPKLLTKAAMKAPPPPPPPPMKVESNEKNEPGPTSQETENAVHSIALNRSENTPSDEDDESRIQVKTERMEENGHDPLCEQKSNGSGSHTDEAIGGYVEIDAHELLAQQVEAKERAEAAAAQRPIALEIPILSSTSTIKSTPSTPSTILPTVPSIVPVPSVPSIPSIQVASSLIVHATLPPSCALASSENRFIPTVSTGQFVAGINTASLTDPLMQCLAATTGLVPSSHHLSPFQFPQQSTMINQRGISIHDNLPTPSSTVLHGAYLTIPEQSQQLHHHHQSSVYQQQIVDIQSRHVVQPTIDIFERYPIKWTGHLMLKNEKCLVQLHYIRGNESLINPSVRMGEPLRINQRMRMEAGHLDGVILKMEQLSEHCMLLALPCGYDAGEILEQSRVLQTAFIDYLIQKMAAGIVNIVNVGMQECQPSHIVHIFAPCDFSSGHLRLGAEALYHEVAARSTPFLLIVITTTTGV